MFTGIIKEIGSIKEISKGSSLTKIGINSGELYIKANVSDSISVNGVCLTITGKKNNTLYFDAVKSTLDKTSLKRLKINEKVNLEPALELGEKLGGHFVLGHVDCEVKLKRIIRKKSYWQLELDLPSKFRKFIVDNGSIALNGISLTVKKVMPRFFIIDIIPFTYENTNLKCKRAGDWVNVEFDYLLKGQAKLH